MPFPSPMHACMLSHFSRVQLCATPWTAVHQASLSTGFSKQEYWSGLPFPSPGVPSIDLETVPENDIGGFVKRQKILTSSVDYLQYFTNKYRNIITTKSTGCSSLECVS